MVSGTRSHQVSVIQFMNLVGMHEAFLRIFQVPRVLEGLYNVYLVPHAPPAMDHFLMLLRSLIVFLFVGCQTLSCPGIDCATNNLDYVSLACFELPYSAAGGSLVRIGLAFECALRGHCFGGCGWMEALLFLWLCICLVDDDSFLVTPILRAQPSGPVNGWSVAGPQLDTVFGHQMSCTAAASGYIPYQGVSPGPRYVTVNFGNPVRIQWFINLLAVHQGSCLPLLWGLSSRGVL